MGTVSIFVCLHVGRGWCIFVCVHEGGNVCLCIWVLVRLRLCVRSGLRLHLTHHLSRPPPHHHALPVEDAAGALVVSRAGAGCSGERRPTLGGRLAGPGPTGLAGPRLGGGGLWVSGPRARSALVWSTAGGACGLAATAPWGVYTVAVGGHTFGLSSALFWVEAAVVPAVVLLGVPCPGGPRMFGARIFSCLLHALRGWGCCSPHTLLNIYMEEPYEHKRDHTHRCTLKHSHWCKNRCSQTTLS